MLPVVPVIQIGFSILSAYGVFQYVQQNYMNFEGALENTWTMNKDLTRNVFGQQVAIYQLTDFMSHTDTVYGTHTLLVIGGPGVGKTLSISIAKNHYEPKELIVNILPSLQNYDEETLELTMKKIKWVTKGFSLVVIDGANVLDQKLATFINKINKFGRENKLRVKVIVIGHILNIHQTNSEGVSVEKFKSIEEYTNFIINTSVKAKMFFEKNNLNCNLATLMPLPPQAIRQCVTAALGKLFLRVKPTEEVIEGIIRDICEDREDFCPSGCKDVDAYVIPFAR